MRRGADELAWGLLAEDILALVSGRDLVRWVGLTEAELFFFVVCFLSVTVVVTGRIVKSYNFILFLLLSLRIQDRIWTSKRGFWASVTCFNSIGVLISGTCWSRYRSRALMSMGCLTGPAISSSRHARACLVSPASFAWPTMCLQQRSRPPNLVVEERAAQDIK